MSGRQHSVEVSPPRGEAETAAFVDIVREALFFPDADLNVWLEREGVEHVRVARTDGRVVGGLIVQPLGQWFGGKVVPMGGVRAVGVSPEHRACGVASALMRASVCEMRERGLCISTLFPATQKVYRRAGYERAGVRRRYRLPTHRIDIRDRSLDVRRIDRTAREALEDLHRKRARMTSGNVERNAWLWDRILDPPPWSKPTDGFLVLRNGRPEGYVVTHNTPGPVPHNNVVEIQDFVAVTHEAARRLWTLLADHRSMAGSVTWCGAPADPLLHLLDEQAYSIEEPIDWMVRINDVPAALTARGYPAALSAELHLDVRDHIIPENNGRFILHVRDGAGVVESGGRGELVIDVRGLASLYTGYLSARDLLTTGQIDGAPPPDPSVLDTASAMFAGPTPWMSDIF